MDSPHAFLVVLWNYGVVYSLPALCEVTLCFRSGG